MTAAGHALNRPRSLVSHLKHLTGTDPVTARKMIEASGKAALKRLGIKPAVKARTKTTSREGRHIIIKLGSGTITPAEPRLVRRRNFRTGRHTFAMVADKAVARRARRRRSVPVYHYTLPQAAAVVAEMKPRKSEYKQLQKQALRAVAAETSAATLRMRMLPRHTKWSKRRHKR